MRVLQAAGVDFAILGNEEKCTGEPARRLGNEYLYQTLAQGNVETLKRYRFQTIVTACPHCFNTIKNEYPQFDGHFRVIHHTQLLDDLMRSGRLCGPTSATPSASPTTTRATSAATTTSTTSPGACSSASTPGAAGRDEAQPRRGLLLRRRAAGAPGSRSTRAGG